MKIGKYMHYMNYEKLKYLFAIHEYENFCLQNMNYEIGKYMHYMNYEKMKWFVCNTWIMKI